MNLLKPAANQTAYLKLGLQGFEGSGKTHLACDFARELTKLVKGEKVAFFDTEKGSDFHIKRFAEVNIQLDVIKSRAFADLIAVIDEAKNGGYSFLIIDSITHVWRELCAAYMKKRGKSRLTMPDWVVLKTEWQQFTQGYVNSPLHIAMCGRAGYEYDFEEDDEGKKEIVKSGTRMKAEGETGFEPDLLIETFKVPLSDVLTDKKAKKAARGFENRCVVLKDRSDTINGRVFVKPKFKDFMGVVKFLNLGGDHVGADLSRTSEDMIKNTDRSWAEREKRKEVALEEIKACFIKAGLDGAAADQKKRRVELLEKHFGKPAWTHVEGLSLDLVLQGLASLKMDLGQAATDDFANAPDGDVPLMGPRIISSLWQGGEQNLKE